MTADLSAVSAAAQAYGDQRAADQKTLDDQAYAALQADFDAYRVAHPVVVDPPAPAPKFYVGGATAGNGDPTPLEKKAGAPYGIRRTYHDHDVKAVVKVVKTNMAAGRAISEISMKSPNWADSASGKDDAWAKDAAAQLAAAVKGTDHVVNVIVNAEPENDTGTNVGNSAAGRNAWKAMQARFAPFFDLPGLSFGVCLMGFHEFYGEKALWNLEASVPKDRTVKWVSFDIYETYGVKQNGVKSAKWQQFENSYFKPISVWCQVNGKTWHLTETGVSPDAFALKPTYFTDIIVLVQKYGGTAYSYFNSNLNSPDPVWQMEPDGPREKAFLAAVREHAAT